MLNRYEGQDTRTLMKALKAGTKIEAIKVLRNLTDLGLKEAKDMVEATVEAIVSHERKPDTDGQFVVMIHSGDRQNYSEACASAGCRASPRATGKSSRPN